MTNFGKEIQKIGQYLKSCKKKTFLIVLVLALCAGAIVFACQPTMVGYIAGSLSYGRTTATTAVTANQVKIYAGRGADYQVIATLPKGTVVELREALEADSGWASIQTPDGLSGWCSRKDLDFSGVNLASSPLAQFPALAGSASSVPVSSSVSSQPTGSSQKVVPSQVTMEKASLPLAVSVSIADQRVTVLDAKQRIVKQFVCSTGAKGSETPIGTFTVKNRGKSFFSQSINEGGYYWTQFDGDYLFHSVPFDKNRRMEPEEAAKLGTPASHGCVRLAIEDAKWIYDNIPRGAVVKIK